MAENEVTGLRLVALGSRTRLIGRFLINFDAESKFPPPPLPSLPPHPFPGSRKSAVYFSLGESNYFWLETYL